MGLWLPKFCSINVLLIGVLRQLPIIRRKSATQLFGFISALKQLASGFVILRKRLVVWPKALIKAGKSLLIWHKISVVTSK